MNNRLGITLPEAPEGYFWNTGQALHDYYEVAYVELRRKTWWSFSETVYWSGYRDITPPYLKLQQDAEQMVKALPTS